MIQRIKLRMVTFLDRFLAENPKSPLPVEKKYIAAKDWFWVLDGYGKEMKDDKQRHIDIERVVFWQDTSHGITGLVSPELKGGFLALPPPVAGGVYKHLDDLNELERNALDKKRS